jgi:hypothetical protein
MHILFGLGGLPLLPCFVDTIAFGEAGFHKIKSREIAQQTTK